MRPQSHVQGRGLCSAAHAILVPHQAHTAPLSGRADGGEALNCTPTLCSHRAWPGCRHPEPNLRGAYDCCPREGSTEPPTATAESKQTSATPSPGHVSPGGASASRDRKGSCVAFCRCQEPPPPDGAPRSLRDSSVVKGAVARWVPEPGDLMASGSRWGRVMY